MKILILKSLVTFFPLTVVVLQLPAAVFQGLENIFLHAGDRDIQLPGDIRVGQPRVAVQQERLPTLQRQPLHGPVNTRQFLLCVQDLLGRGGGIFALSVALLSSLEGQPKAQ